MNAGLAGLAKLALGLIALGLAGCVNTNAYTPLPDLATQSPSRQQVLTPAEQKKAIDGLVAKRDAQQAAGQDADRQVTK